MGGLVLNCIVITDPPWASLKLMQTILKVNTSFVNGNDYGKLTAEPYKEYRFSIDTWDLSRAGKINNTLNKDLI